MNHDEETWLVQLANGDVRMMTVEQLDEAFQKGTIDESTLVRRDGAGAWVKLGDELGQSEPAEAPPSPQSSVSTHPVMTDLPSADDAHLELESMLRAGRRRRWILGGVVATAVLGAFAVVTAVNVSRMRTHAALAAEIATTHIAAPSDPEPETVTNTDSNKNTDEDRARRRRNRAAQGAGQTSAPSDAPASTVFHNGGDDHDPLNGKL
jgi:hypothetical protein